MPPSDWIRRLLGRGPKTETAQPPRLLRGTVDHVVVLDGTMSSLADGYETNAGLTYKLLREAAAKHKMIVRYEPGIQWADWKGTLDVIEGRGINRQIRRVYGDLASRYHEGDRLWLFGYSRGAYAVRALAGMIDRVGLLRPHAATVRNITQAYRHYRADPDGVSARLFRQMNCHPGQVDIEMIGVWDTVKALGIRAPVVWRYSQVEHEFHSLSLGASVKRGRQALALDETRDAFAPVMWETGEYPGDLIQMWFRGTHGDIGGQLGGFGPARGLSNISLVWMLEEAEAAGLPLPEGWRERYPVDPAAPSVGTISGWGKLFLRRHGRPVGEDPSEQVHPTARGHRVLLSG